METIKEVIEVPAEVAPVVGESGGLVTWGNAGIAILVVAGVAIVTKILSD